MAGNSNRRKLLVLDLDETLIHSTEQSIGRDYDFRTGDYFTYKRPGLDDFLECCHRCFKLAVWTSSSADYAARIVEMVFPDTVELEFIFSSNRCVIRCDHFSGDRYVLKPLKKVKKLGFSLAEIMVVDDDPRTFADNYGNAIQVNPYLGLENDNELSLLADYLLLIQDRDDVRRVDKRSWRETVMRSRRAEGRSLIHRHNHCSYAPKEIPRCQF